MKSHQTSYLHLATKLAKPSSFPHIIWFAGAVTVVAGAEAEGFLEDFGEDELIGVADASGNGLNRVLAFNQELPGLTQASLHQELLGRLVIVLAEEAEEGAATQADILGNRLNCYGASIVGVDVGGGYLCRRRVTLLARGGQADQL